MRVRVWIRHERQSRGDSSKQFKGIHSVMEAEIPDPEEGIAEVILVTAGGRAFIALDALDSKLEQIIEPAVRRVMAHMDRYFLTTLGRPISQMAGRKNPKTVKFGVHETKGVVLTDGDGNPKL